MSGVPNVIVERSYPQRTGAAATGTSVAVTHGNQPLPKGLQKMSPKNIRSLLILSVLLAALAPACDGDGDGDGG